MKRKEIMDVINNLLEEENANTLEANQKLSEACLDSLGLVIFFTELDAVFSLLGDNDGFAVIEELKTQDPTMKELVNKCKSLINEE